MSTHVNKHFTGNNFHVFTGNNFCVFTGQSLGSMWLGWEAMTKLVPDVFIDSMGYAFTLPMFKYLAASTVACYVHYPTISTDMLTRVASRTAAHNNAAFISNSGFLSSTKLLYYQMFAWLYKLVGQQSDLIMVNSSWTGGHISQLWGVEHRIHVVYPPCDTIHFSELPLSTDEVSPHTIVSVAQFRPEKDHELQIRSFARFLKETQGGDSSRLVLIGSCRNEEDERRVNTLKQLCTELCIQDQVDFKLNIDFADLKKELNQATIGLHTMWNEHFGIGNGNGYYCIVLNFSLSPILQ